MKLSLNQLQGLVYDEANNVYGEIVNVDILNGTLTLNTGESEHTALAVDVKFLPVIGELNGEVIVDGDVLQIVGNDELSYEVELQEDGDNIVFYLLNDEFERVEAGEAFSKSQLVAIFGEILVPVANIHELKNLVFEEETVDFNIKVVKDTHGIYYYACNNVVDEVVDVIKVVFIGANLLEEEYSRSTFSYEEYLEFISIGFITEVTPQELQSYAYQAMRGNVQANSGTFTGTLSTISGATIEATKVLKCFSDCSDDCQECEEIEEIEDGCGEGCGCLHTGQDSWQ